jgi:acetylglutamate kinase
LETELNKVIVVKLGGSIFHNKDTTIADIVQLQQQGRQLVVIHGGANIVNGWLKRLSIPTRIIHGERATDAATLEVVAAVLGGLVNKEIVAAIFAAGGQAVGISGADGGLLQAKMRNEEMGYMGNVVRVDPAPLMALLMAGIVPVVSPVSLHAVDRPKGAPRLLNINGDPAAGEIAAAINAERLIFLTDVDGIRDDSGRLLADLTPEEAEALLTSGVASGGMIPKVKACLRGISGGAIACVIDGNQPHILLKEIEEGGCGTRIAARVG